MPARFDSTSAPKTAPPRTTICMECLSSFEGAGGYHPYLYCELIKLGHIDPEKYLASYGFIRRPLRASA